MAKLKLKTTILSKLSTLTRSEGNLVITRDGESLYFDTDSKRFRISDFIDIADDNDRLAILAPNTEKMYYVLSTDAVWRYISGSWHEVTSTEDISDILIAISGKADSNKAYLTDDSNGTDVVDDDYIPFYDTSASAKKRSTFSNLVAKIKAKLITDTYSGTSTIGMSGKAVKSAIDALDVSSTSIGSGETLATIAETDGKISVTKQNIKIGLGQMDNFYRCGTNSSISGSNTWHKIASATPSATTNTDYTLMLAVNDTYLSDTDDNISDAGILYCRVRQATSGGVDSVNYANLKFVANSGLDASKFRLYHKTDSNGITFEIWTSMNRQYAWRRFSVISQGDRTSTYSNAWTLYNSTSPSAAPTESSTCVKVDCIDDTIVNDASLTINQNGVSKGTFTANQSGEGTTVNLTDTTYAFTGGTNKFSVSVNGGTASDVNITPSIENNITGSGTSGYLAKFNGNNTIASGPKLGTSTTTFLNNKGEWATPAGTYSLPVADSSNLGGVKIGYSASGKNYAVQLDTNNKMYVNVPWTDTSGNDKLPLSGGTLTGNLLLKKTSSQTNPDTDDPALLMLRTTYTPSGGSAVNSSATIRAYSDRGNGSGANLVIQPGGNLFIGSGESPEAHYALYKNSGSERTFITADSDINIQAGGNNPIGNRKGLKIQTDGSLVPNVADTATNNAGSIGTSDYKWANVYATKLNGNTIPNGSGTLALTSDIPTAASSAPGKVASSSSTGTSTNYARQDHTHGIDLATGDSNGQVKIAGTNVSVKGLGSNAYTSTSYLPLAGGTMTGNVKYTYSTADVTLANNGVSSGIKYPMFKQINDKNGNRIMMIEGLVNSDGTLGIGLNVWNYTYNGTTQTNLYKKGIKMILDKSNSMTYSVDDAANFRTAIGCANNKVTQTSTPLTTDATYRVLLSQNANDTTQTVGARKCSNLTFNPKSGILDVGIDQGGSIDTSSIKIAPYGDNGILDIGNSSNVITRISPATTATSTVDIGLPSQSGTLALQENVPSLTWKSGGSKNGTGNYKTSAPSTCSEILLVVNLNDGTTTNIYTCINIPAPIVTATKTSTQRFRGGYFQSSTAGGEVSYWIWKASNVFYIAQDIVYMNGTSAASNTTCYVYYR